MDATVPEGIEELKTLCMTELRIQGQPRTSVQRFLEKAKVTLTAALPHRCVKISHEKEAADKAQNTLILQPDNAMRSIRINWSIR